MLTSPYEAKHGWEQKSTDREKESRIQVETERERERARSIWAAHPEHGCKGRQ